MKKIVLTASVALFALAETAFAQSNAENAPAGKTGDAGMGEIVVTAQRRSENVQAVPISITAITGAQLTASGVASTQDLTQVTPGLFWARSTFNSQPTIRGIGSRNASAGDEPNVATFIDGVYQPEQISTLQELANVERVEVLKGPQGTLFGRNATGGAINIVTRKPSFALEGEATATYGDFDYGKGSLFVSGPLVADKVAASVSAVTLGDEGYIHNVYLNTTQGYHLGDIIRGKLLFKPTDDLEIQLNGLYSYTRDNVTYSAEPLNGNSAARLTPNPGNIPLDVLIPTAPYTTATKFQPYLRSFLRMFDGHLTYDLGWATLSGLFSYAKTHTTSHSQTDVSPFGLSVTDFASYGESENEEIVLTSPTGGAWSWLAGVTGFQGSARFNPLLQTTPATVIPAPIVYGQDTNAVAGFGEATYEPLDNLFLTAGLRFSWDQKQSYNRAVLTGVATQHTANWTNFSPRVVARYEFAPNSNVYASFTEGYKSGTYNPTTVVGAINPASPEKIKAYEIGVKSEVTDWLRLNAAAFHYDYTDLQVSVVITTPGLPAVTMLQNAPSAAVDGFEANADAWVLDNLKLNAGISVMNANVTDFHNASVILARTNSAGQPTRTGNVSGIANVTGKYLIRAPNWTVNIGGTYTHDLFGGEISLTASAFFSDRYFVDLLNRVNQPSYEVVNASATWRAPDQHLFVTVFGKNLTDKVYATGFLESTFTDYVSYEKPRWFGFTVGYDL